MKKSLLLSFLSFALFISCEEDASSRDEVVGVWYMPQSLNRVTAGSSADRLGGYSLNAWNYSLMVTTNIDQKFVDQMSKGCLLYTSPSPRDQRGSRMPSSA